MFQENFFVNLTDNLISDLKYKHLCCFENQVFASFIETK